MVSAVPVPVIDLTSSDDGQDGNDASARGAANLVTPARKRKADTLDASGVEVARNPSTADNSTTTDPLVDFKIESMPGTAMPSSISDVIRLMDEICPDQKYYQRQKDSRGECSKMRNKLRTFAKRNEDQLGVAHWVETKNWKPPSDETLRALMVLIRGMIDNTWPACD